MRGHFCLTFLLAASVLPTAAGQQAPPTFKSNVQLIEVDARVFDKNGIFVGDLTKDDFEVLEAGKPQRIDAMFLVTGTARSAAPRPGEPLPPPLPASAGPAAPQTWIFFFDLNHLSPGAGFDRARKAVTDFVAERFKDGDLAGIVAGETMVGKRLTTARSELLGYLAQVKPRAETRTLLNELTREWPRFLNEEEAIDVARYQKDVVDRVKGRACADDPDYCRMGDPEPAVRAKGIRFQQAIHRASQQTLVSLNALASGLSKIPGPKTVVFLSDGFVVQDIETTLRSVVGQIARAGARVYSVDVRGLNRGGNPGIIDQPQVEDAYNATVKFDGLENAPNSLAVDTGGLMIRNQNNIGRALDRIADDAGRYYVLAYQPANTDFDGSYRPIQVRVKREGLRVRARNGYLALPPSRMTVPSPLTAPASPLAAGGPPASPGAVAAAPEPPGVTSGLPAPLSTSIDIGTRTGAGGDAAAPGALRIRPDAESRVKELSARNTSAAPVSTHATQGWAAYQRGDLESALGPLTEASRQPDVQPWVLYALGLSQSGLGKLPEAIATWERVREAAPDFKAVYMDLAATHTSLSDLTSALAVLRQAEGRWPKDPEVHNAIGVVHFRRGALDEAIQAFTAATIAAPEEGLGYLNLGRAYELRFTRSRRYVTSQRRWVVDEGDRRKAIENFQAYLRIGGPYVSAATDGLQRLEWAK